MNRHFLDASCDLDIYWKISLVTTRTNSVEGEIGYIRVREGREERRRKVRRMTTAMLDLGDAGGLVV